MLQLSDPLIKVIKHSIINLIHKFIKPFVLDLLESITSVASTEVPHRFSLWSFMIFLQQQPTIPEIPKKSNRLLQIRCPNKLFYTLKEVCRKWKPKNVIDVCMK